MVLNLSLELIVQLRLRCEEALINDHVEIITDEFQALLDADKIPGEFGVLFREYS